MSEKAQYRTVVGMIQFDPESRDAAGKPARNIAVRQTGFGPTAPMVYITLWDEDFGSVELERGDIVLVDGKYSANKSKDGSKTYHNIAANKVAKLGTAATRTPAAVASDDTEGDDEDIPF